MYRVTLIVSPVEIDPQYNHLHHSKVFHLLEQARIGFMDSVGKPYHELLAQGVFLVIRGVRIRYRREIFSGPVEITCENVIIRGKMLLIDQKIYEPEGKLAVSARFELVCVAGEPKSAISLPNEFASALLTG